MVSREYRHLGKGFDWLKDKWGMNGKLKKVIRLSEFIVNPGVSTASFKIVWWIKNPNVSTVIRNDHENKINLTGILI